MRTLNFTKIIAILAFIGLAGFSCFWTAESLFIWQPSLTIYGAWMIAVVFFIVASICFGKFLKSLDRQEDFYGKLFGRGGAFLLGLIGLVIFWLCFSLPTNTHTLLYRASISNVLTNDLNRTQGYLQGLRDNNVEIKKIEKKYKAKTDAVNAHILRLLAEIDNPSHLGIGHRFEKVLSELDVTLSEGMSNPTKLQRVGKVGNNRSEWIAAVNYYQRQAYDQLRIYRAACDKEIASIKAMMGSKELKALIKNNETSLHDIANMDGVNNDIIKAALKDLTNSYGYIKTNAQYINFKDGDKEIYTRDNVLPVAQAMLSVPDVWRDYLFTNKYDGYGIIWWVLVALLVDLAGFIFFNMAFDNKNNNAIA